MSHWRSPASPIICWPAQLPCPATCCVKRVVRENISSSWSGRAALDARMSIGIQLWQIIYNVMCAEGKALQLLGRASIEAGPSKRSTEAMANWATCPPPRAKCIHNRNASRGRGAQSSALQLSLDTMQWHKPKQCLAASDSNAGWSLRKRCGCVVRLWVAAMAQS